MTRTNKEEKAAYTFALGVVHKLHLQDEVGRCSKNVQFLSTYVYTIENVNAGGRWSKKSQNLVKVVCERPFTDSGAFLELEQ